MYLYVNSNIFIYIFCYTASCMLVVFMHSDKEIIHIHIFAKHVESIREYTLKNSHFICWLKFKRFPVENSKPLPESQISPRDA